MLYSGDDDNWKHARATLSPYFMTSNFDALNDKIGIVVEKHRTGRAELLEVLLFITVDLLCEVLYGCSLPADELGLLVRSVTEYTIPGTSFKGVYPGNVACEDHHRRVGATMAEAAPKGTLGHILLRECPSLPARIRYENCAFFLEALTPCFASFWTISSLCVASGTDKAIKKRAGEDTLFREQCIKEALRMHPPVPMTWARGAKHTQIFENPLYDPDVKASSSWFSKWFGSSDIRTKEHITIKKGTKVMIFPSIFHYDDRFWKRPEEYLPS